MREGHHPPNPPTARMNGLRSRYDPVLAPRITHHHQPTSAFTSRAGSAAGASRLGAGWRGASWSRGGGDATAKGSWRCVGRWVDRVEMAKEERAFEGATPRGGESKAWISWMARLEQAKEAATGELDEVADSFRIRPPSRAIRAS